VIVNDLDVFSAGALPAKTDPELVVHSNAPLPRAVALQKLEPVRRGRAHVFDASRQVQLLKLAQRRALDVRESGDALEAEQGRSVGALERPDRNVLIATGL